MRFLRPICVCIMITLVCAGFLFWSNFVIDTESVQIELKKLPSAFENLRIVELADLHGREFDTDNAYLLQAVRAAKPDLICINGDLLDENTDQSMLKPLLRGLCEIAPTFYVTGNHEWQLDNLQTVLRKMEEYGVTVLQNEYTVLVRGEARLVIAGVNDPCGPWDQKTPQELVAQIRKEEGDDACILMLAHRNDTIDMWAELGVDLVLTGHCHGGVVRLPFVGGVFGTKRRLFPEYDAGLFAKENTRLFVSRGLGYTNVRLRLFNRPHLPVLTLVNNS